MRDAADDDDDYHAPATMVHVSFPAQTDLGRYTSKDTARSLKHSLLPVFAYNKGFADLRGFHLPVPWMSNDITSKNQKA